MKEFGSYKPYFAPFEQEGGGEIAPNNEEDNIINFIDRYQAEAELPTRIMKTDGIIGTYPTEMRRYMPEINNKIMNYCNWLAEDGKGYVAEVAACDMLRKMINHPRYEVRMAPSEFETSEYIQERGGDLLVLEQHPTIEGVFNPLLLIDVTTRPDRYSRKTKPEDGINNELGVAAGTVSFQQVMYTPRMFDKTTFRQHLDNHIRPAIREGNYSWDIGLTKKQKKELVNGFKREIGKTCQKLQTYIINKSGLYEEQQIEMLSRMNTAKQILNIT